MENEKNPLVSIVIPCYNHDKYVQECIRSVIAQDYENIELIIIDDGSKDESVIKIQELVPQCEKHFIRFDFRTRPNKGLCVTLNEALEWCEGKYVSFIASDDVMRPYKTREQAYYLENNLNSIGVFGGVEVLYKNNYKKEIKKNKNSYNFDDILLHKHNLPAPTSMLRLDNVRAVNGFREGFIIEDWIMWLDLTEAGGKLDYIDKVFSLYRRHDNNLSANLEKMYAGRMQVVEVFKNKKNYNKAKARVNLIQARDLQNYNKYESIRFAYKSVLADFGILFSISFIKFLIKFFIFKRGGVN
ncbi:glycosyltransferase family 2 protein [Marinobacterium sediminicola]|uniref:Alpha-1,3-rhamnosyltransferase n=1 Tax=Marinobacterium sediminicola TaxID=518898 RepID=A0ABY1S0M7_9GAMM|nr:glycosyltransferase [Marinobacterium sediminicola]ULG68388.1 glycosyltransferase [Marinobacterium sediminicola]SMR74733.1 alpha-1,3-rhamnosyltransferase [Marinobacterium sediminicola]